jgi:HemY protein
MIKRKIFWWLLMCMLLILIIWLIGNNQGYVLIVRSPYRIQVSFNFLLALFVLCFLGLHYSLRFLHFLRRLPLIRYNRKEALRLKAGNAALLEGMHALAEGDFEKAEHAAKLAQTLVQNNDLEKLIQTLAKEKNKQGALFQ